ncbi:MAG: lycopene cyclase domain-containing protein [Rhodothermales bacterium]|nr:lycopene cyclase domain-containing protein [Rhodothermales bacterium]
MSRFPQFSFIMTYLGFHCVFILPPLAILLLMAWRRGVLAGAWRAIALTMVIALVYTTPWDNYLVYRSIWWYGADRVVGTIGYVPIEEYLFFLLQPWLAGLVYALFFAGRTGRGSSRSGAIVAVVFVVLSLWGAYLLIAGGDRMTYLGLILAWACPVIAGMWLFAGPFFGPRLGLMAAATLIPSVYLWAADRLAIGLEIWTIAAEYSTGYMLLGLPIEEATFFLLTDLLVVSGVSLFMHGDSIAAARRRLEPAALAPPRSPHQRS